MATTLIGQLVYIEAELSSQPSERVTVTYLVQSTDPTDTPGIVQATAGIPVIGDAYIDNAAMTVQRIRPRRDEETWQLWKVDVEYSTISGSLNPIPGGDDPNPLNRPAIESRSTEVEMIVAEKGKLYDPSGADSDANGFTNNEVAVCNSAGDLFLNPPLKERHISVVTFRRNEASYTQSIANQYIGGVNNAAWYGDGIHEWLIADISADLNPPEGVYPEYWTVTYVLKWREDGWYSNIQDMGLYRYVYDNATRRRIRIEDDDGVPVDTPVPLDGAGGLADLAVEEDPSFGIVYRKYLFHKEVNFDDLDLLP